MIALHELQLSPCPKGTPPLGKDEITALLEKLPGWTVAAPAGEDQLSRAFEFRDFAAAMAFSNQVGELAEAENHHPAIVTEWGRVTLTWWTHSIGGLHTNDFIMAARCENLYSRL